LWRGKAQFGAGDGAYTRTLAALAQSKPESYEGQRAAELLQNPAAPPLSQTVALAPNALNETCGETRGVYVCLPPDEGKAEAEAWMRSWLGISDTVDISAVGDAIRQDPRFAQGHALWQMGFRAEAMAEFQNLLNNTREPLALWQLAVHWRGIGVFRLSISAADALVRISPAKTALNAPLFLGRMVYPAYYGGVIVNAAREFGVNPLLAFSLVRQESLFEPFAESGAAANGLFQVIPLTGKEIAGQLGWPPDYSVDDLQRPLVSARFGAYYMSRQLKFFGDWFTALAAYNAGPGAAGRWAASDPDVFAAKIPIRETSGYVQHITTNFGAYSRLYGR
jgi:soluble lytic murein transglycosylase